MPRQRKKRRATSRPPSRVAFDAHALGLQAEDVDAFGLREWLAPEVVARLRVDRWHRAVLRGTVFSAGIISQKFLVAVPPAADYDEWLRNWHQAVRENVVRKLYEKYGEMSNVGVERVEELPTQKRSEGEEEKRREKIRRAMKRYWRSEAGLRRRIKMASGKRKTRLRERLARLRAR